LNFISSRILCSANFNPVCERDMRKLTLKLSTENLIITDRRKRYLRATAYRKNWESGNARYLFSFHLFQQFHNNVIMLIILQCGDYSAHQLTGILIDQRCLEKEPNVEI